MAIDTRKSLVKKYNPNHGADGRFTSGSSGLGNRRIAERGGGTAGVPTKDAFGRTMTGYRNPNPAKTGPSTVAIKPVHGYRNPHPPTKQTAAAHSPIVQQAAAHMHGQSDGGTNKTRDPNYNQGEGDPELAGSVPYQVQNPAGPGFQFSSAQRQANAREMFGVKAPKDRVFIPGVTDEFGRTAGEQAAAAKAKVYDPYGETLAVTPKAVTPNILIRPDSYAETLRTPKGFGSEPARPRSADVTPSTPSKAKSADVVPPKEGTIHAKSKDIGEYPTRRNEGESLKSYVERRNSLLKAQRDRDAKLAKAHTPKHTTPPYLKPKSKTPLAHDYRRVR
jgi:hypothetical protein